jgi:hypothetical protein
MREDAGHEGSPVFMRMEAWERLSAADRKALLAVPVHMPDGAKAEADKSAVEIASLKAQLAAAQAPRANDQTGGR